MIRQLSLLMLVCVAGTFSMAANGDDAAPAAPKAGAGDHPHGPPPEVKAAFDSCFTSLGIAKPEKGKHLDKADHEKLEACVKAKGIEMPKHFGHHMDFEKMKACLADAGVTLPPRPTDGSRPVLTDAQKKAMHACHEKLEGESKKKE